MPLLSEYDTPAGAYITQSPDGLDTRHDSAVPTEIVPLGQLVAIVMAGSFMAMYPDGQVVLGAAACVNPGIHTNKNIIRFISATLIN